MRQIVLDTETTGLEVAEGHRLIEVGCVELVNRRATGRVFHRYINPERVIDAGAMAVHGITGERLAAEPRFAELAQELWDFIEGAELIIHNAAFDIGFLDMELERAGFARRIADACRVIDTVAMARKLHPGQKAGLDALCRRYNVDHSRRRFHGALLDASLLADVYLAMTGGQSALLLDDAGGSRGAAHPSFAQLLGGPLRPLRVLQASDEERRRHVQRLQGILKKSGGKLIWSDELRTTCAPAP